MAPPSQTKAEDPSSREAYLSASAGFAHFQLGSSALEAACAAARGAEPSGACDPRAVHRLLGAARCYALAVAVTLGVIVLVPAAWWRRSRED